MYNCKLTWAYIYETRPKSVSQEIFQWTKSIHLWNYPTINALDYNYGITICYVDTYKLSCTNYTHILKFIPVQYPYQMAFYSWVEPKPAFLYCLKVCFWLWICMYMHASFIKTHITYVLTCELWRRLLK